MVAGKAIFAGEPADADRARRPPRPSRRLPQRALDDFQHEPDRPGHGKEGHAQNNAEENAADKANNRRFHFASLCASDPPLVEMPQIPVLRGYSTRRPTGAKLESRHPGRLCAGFPAERSGSISGLAGRRKLVVPSQPARVGNLAQGCTDRETGNTPGRRRVAGHGFSRGTASPPPPSPPPAGKVQVWPNASRPRGEGQGRGAPKTTAEAVACYTTGT